MNRNKEHVLFGGTRSWKASDWAASDDRVRGGNSQSYLDTVGSSARFHGHLDIKTLGGAGFASQRTIAEDVTYDLSEHDGILLHLGKSDGKKYTFVVKDELLPKNPVNGRDQATISWEFDFSTSQDAAQAEASSVFIAWKDLKPTYRGKHKKGTEKLDTGNIRRFSIMMRSFFGDQEGDFSLNIKSIKAISRSTDVEKGVVEYKEGSGRFHTPVLISVLAIVTLSYGVFTYIYPWIQGTRIFKRWGW